MSELVADELLILAYLEDPAFIAEVLEETALELSSVEYAPQGHMGWLSPVLDPSLAREIGVQACTMIAEQQAALNPPPPRLVPVSVRAVPRGERSARQRSSTLMPVVLLVLLLVFGSILLANVMTPADGVQNAATPSPSMFSSRPLVQNGYNVTTGNELSARQINQLFAENGSPAAGDGQNVVDLGNKYGIDDIYFAAWYLKETSMGKSGVASVNNPTGMECSDLCPRCSGSDNKGGNWCEFDTIPQGFEAWFKQTRERYVSGLIDQTCSYSRGRDACHPGVPLTTVYLIACGPDGQGMYDSGATCAGYAQEIQGFVDGWRARFGS